MPDRTRPIRKEICLNKQEMNLVQHKMRQLGTHNFGAYARKMLIDGYIIKVDYTEQKKLAAAVSRAASNINHVCHRINSTKGDISMDNILTVPIHLKMTLTAREAAEYSNIGINKIGSMLRAPNCPFVLFAGTKKLVKRREFEQYISRTMAI
mgnify:FL=1